MDLEHERRLSEVESRSKSNSHRLDKLEESTEAIHRMAVALEKVATKQDTMSANVDKLTNKVEALESEPAKKWRFVVEKSIYIIVAAVVGYFLAQVGL